MEGAISLTIAPVEINVEDDLRSAPIDAVSATIILGLSGIALLASIGRVVWFYSSLSIIALLSLNKSLLSLETFATLYIGVVVIFILLRRSLSRFEIAIYRGSVDVIDLVIISWIATIAFVGIPMLMATLVLLSLRSNLLIPKDLRGIYGGEIA